MSPKAGRILCLSLSLVVFLVLFFLTRIYQSLTLRKQYGTQAAGEIKDDYRARYSPIGAFFLYDLLYLPLWKLGGRKKKMSFILNIVHFFIMCTVVGLVIGSLGGRVENLRVIGEPLGIQVVLVFLQLAQYETVAGPADDPAQEAPYDPEQQKSPDMSCNNMIRGELREVNVSIFERRKFNVIFCVILALSMPLTLLFVITAGIDYKLTVLWVWNGCVFGSLLIYYLCMGEAFSYVEIHPDGVCFAARHSLKRCAVITADPVFYQLLELKDGRRQRKFILLSNKSFVPHPEYISLIKLCREARRGGTQVPMPYDEQTIPQQTLDLWFSVN